MRTSKISLATIVALLLLSPVLAAANVHAAATIRTDQSDYQAGTVVTIYGSGFLPLTPITVSVTDPVNAVTSWTVTSDLVGSFTTTYQLDHVYGNYLVTATDGLNNADTTFHDAGEAANLDQCTNGTIGPPPAPEPCIIGTVGGTSYSNWVNGNSNGQKSHWREGDFIAYRVTVTGVTPGAHTLDFSYDIVHNSAHAIDYLGSVDATETFSTTPTTFHANNNNPCIDKLPASQCAPATSNPTSFIAIPPAIIVNCDGSKGNFTSAQAPGNVFIWGPTGTSLDSFTYTSQNVLSGSGACSTNVQLGFSSVSGGSTVVIAWGGHIASDGDWGTGNAATAINGSPYHMALGGLDGTSTGAQDRALSSSAIFYLPSLSTIIEDSAGNPVTYVTVGTPVRDTATLSGSSSNAGGSVTYTVYNTGTCSGTKLSTQTVSVTNSVVPDSGPFIPMTAGSYSYNTTYSGDSHNYAAAALCEPFTVGATTPTLTTNVSPSALTLGPSPVSAIDTVTLSNGVNPTGTITFTVYNDNTCSTPPSFTSAPVTVNGNGNYNSPAFTPSAPGTYYWVASYSGDANNNPYTASCGENGETLTVQSAGPIVTTSVSPSTITMISTASSASDTATLSGGHNPTGTITFTVFFNDPTCATSPVFSSTVQVNGNGNYASAPFSPTNAGSYYWVASYSGDTNNNPFSAPCGVSGETLTVQPAGPTIVTSVSPSTIDATSAGSAIDTATLSGGFYPTGTITFTVYYADASCTTNLVFTSTVNVNGNGNYQSSAFTPLNAGGYYWVASYSGDLNNNPFTAPCGANGETLTVQWANPTIVTSVSPSTVTLGGSQVAATDTAALSGGISPTGTITFTIYYANATCNGTPVFTSTVTVNGNGNYHSEPFTPTAIGAYQWVASYSGDGRNNPFTAPCGATGETLTVQKARPPITTSASPSTISLSSSPVSAADTATLSGGYNPTGTITFAVYYANASCTSTPLFTSLVVVNGNGNYVSASFTPASAGTYYWVASYSGDTNNNPFTAPCGASGETLTVQKANPTVTTWVLDSSGKDITYKMVEQGVPVHDTAAISGGFPTVSGTMTYYFFTTGDCSGTPASTQTVTVSGGIVPGAAPQTLPTGTFSYRTVYSGDSNNNQAAGVCEPFTSGIPVNALTETPIPYGDTIAMCNFDTNTNQGGSEFRLLFTQNSTNTYQLTASNPGQFVYNVFQFNGTSVSITATIPYPFVTHGAVPVHVYDTVTIVTLHGQTCFVPGKDVTPLYTITPSPVGIITLSSYAGKFGTTTTVTVNGPLPSTGQAYVWIHLDYGLKKTTGYSKVTDLKTGTRVCDLTKSIHDNDANATLTGTATVSICDNDNYAFSATGTITLGNASTTIQNNNVFKRDPGIAGFVTDTNGFPVPGATVKVYDNNGKLVATLLTDQDGFYSYAFKYTGKQTIYSLVVTTSWCTVSKYFSIKSNQSVWVDVTVLSQF